MKYEFREKEGKKGEKEKSKERKEEGRGKEGRENSWSLRINEQNIFSKIIYNITNS